MGVCRRLVKTYGAGRRPIVLASWDGKEIVGLAPFFLVDTVRRWGKWWQLPTLVGDGSEILIILTALPERDKNGIGLLASYNFLADKGRVGLLELQRNSTEFTVPSRDDRVRPEQNGDFNSGNKGFRVQTLKLPARWK